MSETTAVTSAAASSSAAPVTPPEAHAAAPACAFCGVTLAGAFCSACGQASVAARQTLRETLLGQTGRIAHTLRLLLTRPGELAVEIDQGRDRDSLKPLTLLLHLLAAFFVIASFTGFGVNAVLEVGLPATREWVDTAIAQMGVERAFGLDRLQRRFQAVYTLFLPFVAFFVGGIIAASHPRRPAGWRVPIAAGIHYECFSLLWLGAMLWAIRAAGFRTYASVPVLVVQYAVGVSYLTLMLRRIYRQAWLTTIAKAALALLCGSALANALIFTALYIVTHVPA